MIPYAVYMITTLYYLTYYVTGVKGSPDEGFFVGDAGSIILRWIILICTIGFLAIEFVQMKSLGKAYFSDKWNWLHMTTYIYNLSILLIHVLGNRHDPLNLAYAASVCSLGVWYMIFYWMRLF